MMTHQAEAHKMNMELAKSLAHRSGYRGRHGNLGIGGWMWGGTTNGICCHHPRRGRAGINIIDTAPVMDLATLRNCGRQ